MTKCFYSTLVSIFSLSVTKDMHVMDTEKIRQCGIANQALLFQWIRAGFIISVQGHGKKF